jgi:hypothetical protein
MAFAQFIIDHHLIYSLRYLHEVRGDGDAEKVYL